LAKNGKRKKRKDTLSPSGFEHYHDQLNGMSARYIIGLKVREKISIAQKKKREAIRIFALRSKSSLFLIICASSTAELIRS
jgi:hypothetical protein